MSWPEPPSKDNKLKSWLSSNSGVAFINSIVIMFSTWVASNVDRFLQIDPLSAYVLLLGSGPLYFYATKYMLDRQSESTMTTRSVPFEYIKEIIYLYLRILLGPQFEDKYRVFIYFYNPYSERLVPIEALTISSHPSKAIEWAIGSGAVGKAFKSMSIQEGRIDETPNDDPIWNIPESILPRLEKDTKAVLAIPMTNKKNQAFGIFSMSSKEGFSKSFGKPFRGKGKATPVQSLILHLVAIMMLLLRENYAEWATQLEPAANTY